MAKLPQTHDSDASERNLRARSPVNHDSVDSPCMSTELPSYVLITPARNEEEYIERTLESVIRQTVRPFKWIIVSDGSTDRTDEIVERIMARQEWIELVRMPAGGERNFASKVLSFNAGLNRIKDLDYGVVGNLDADLSFDSDMFEFLMGKFASNPRLGVAGAPFTEGEGMYNFRFSSTTHVSGACQLFRRRCFHEIGGYTPMGGGGVDVLAVLTARMKGWETRTFPEKVCFHHRPMGSARHRSARASFELGQKDYMLGRHPLWQLFRAFYQMGRAPVAVGGVMLFAGYSWSAIRRLKRSVPADVVAFQRHEQMQRLKELFTGWTRRGEAG